MHLYALTHEKKKVQLMIIFVVNIHTINWSTSKKKSSYHDMCYICFFVLYVVVKKVY